jgi:hypothetical protein
MADTIPFHVVQVLFRPAHVVPVSKIAVQVNRIENTEFTHGSFFSISVFKEMFRSALLFLAEIMNDMDGG